MAFTSDSIFVLAKEDASALANLERDCFSTGWDATVYERFLLDDRVFLQDFGDRELPELFVTGVLDEKTGSENRSVQAYLSMRLIQSLGQAEVFNIAVQPQFRGLGLGSRLLATVVQFLQARKFTEFLLEVRLGNAPARALYARQGFVSCGQRPRYYPDGEDALLMQLGAPHP